MLEKNNAFFFHVLWQKHQKEHQIDAMNLALGGKDMKIGGSMDSTPSLSHDEEVFKAEPSKSAHKVAAIDTSTVLRNIVKTL